MNNLKLKILEYAYTRPGLTIGGLADSIAPGQRTEQDVRHLVNRGYLLDERGLELSNKGLACVDSASLRNRAKRLGKSVLGLALSVVAVVVGNWIWRLTQSFL